MKTKAANKSSITIPTFITEEMIESLIISALEGGSNYWYRIENEKIPRNKDRCVDVLKIIRGKASLSISEYMQTGKETESGRLTRASIIAGLSLMSKDYPHHFANLLNENADAETGDVFLQLAILGDLVYG